MTRSGFDATQLRSRLRAGLRQAVAGCFLGGSSLGLCALGCEREAAAPAPASVASKPAATAQLASQPSSAGAPAANARSASARCVQPRAEPAPPVAAPASRCPVDSGAAPAPLPRGQVHFTDAPSGPRVSVELARDDEARSRGLMYRTRMDADHGMLFSWDGEAKRSFWMQNTCIPLDMLFIAADGTVVGILEQVPTLNELPREVRCPARHVLELNAGWARAHGVMPGQHVDLET